MKIRKRIVIYSRKSKYTNTGDSVGNQIELAHEPTGFDSKKYEVVDIYEQENDNILTKKKKKACKLIPNKEERKTIEIIARKYLEIKSLTGLETYLIKHNIVSRTGVYFSTSRLRVLLTNLVYATYDEDMKEYLEKKGIHIFTEPDRESADGRYGLISYNKMDGYKNSRDMSDWIIAVGLHPGYIKGIDFIRIQELIEKNSSKRYRAKCKNNALFSGLIRCKECGSYMRPKMTGNQPKNNEKRRYYYTCELKDRSKGTKCQGANIVGIAMDNLIVEKLKEIFVPSSEIYKELKKMAISKTKQDENEEIEILNKTYNKNLEAIKNLIEKLKFMDIDVAPLINDELKKLKNENQELQEKIEKLQKEQQRSRIKRTAESKSAELILDIINNCFNNFDELDLKMKKDILKIFIKDIYGNGDKVEVNILNTKLEETTKKLFSNTIEESNFKNQSDVAIRTGEQWHQ